MTTQEITITDGKGHKLGPFDVKKIINRKCVDCGIVVQEFIVMDIVLSTIPYCSRCEPSGWGAEWNKYKKTKSFWNTQHDVFELKDHLKGKVVSNTWWRPRTFNSPYQMDSYLTTLEGMYYASVQCFTDRVLVRGNAIPDPVVGYYCGVFWG